MGKTNPTIKKYKSQASIRSSGKKVKKLNDKTLKSFFTTEHNLKYDENIYKCLDVESTKVKKKVTSQQPPKENKPHKPPPLIVTDKNCKMDKILCESGITKFNLKMLSIGTKIFLDSDNDLVKISNLLKQNNVEHFSYAPKDQKTYKVVLAGLPEIPVKLIEEELQSLNIRPEQVIQMTIKNPNPHRALYLIHLNGKENTFQDIQKIKSICHTLVKWSKYQPKSRGPTQCRNCTMYGHGTRNCFRKTACTLCASTEHSQQNCHLNNLSKESSPVYKCSYCSRNNLQSTNHRANDINCPGRKVYIEARTNSFQRQKNHTNQPRTSQRKNQERFAPAPNPPPLIRSFKDVVANSEQTETAKANTNNYDNNSDLFSTAELLKIFMKAVEEIRNCKTKLDQIQVITNLLSHVV